MIARLEALPCAPRRAGRPARRSLCRTALGAPPASGRCSRSSRSPRRPGATPPRRSRAPREGLLALVVGVVEDGDLDRLAGWALAGQHHCAVPPAASRAVPGRGLSGSEWGAARGRVDRFRWQETQRITRLPASNRRADRAVPMGRRPSSLGGRRAGAPPWRRRLPRATNRSPAPLPQPGCPVPGRRRTASSLPRTPSFAKMLRTR